MLTVFQTSTWMIAWRTWVVLLLAKLFVLSAIKLSRGCVDTSRTCISPSLNNVWFVGKSSPRNQSIKITKGECIKTTTKHIKWLLAEEFHAFRSCSEDIHMTESLYTRNLLQRPINATRTRTLTPNKNRLSLKCDPPVDDKFPIEYIYTLCMW
jgi:hypothetical protein